MKLLLVAVNAKYIHSNLAVYCLRAYAGKHGFADQVSLAEYTINHSEEDILREIYKEKADVIAFSCYIWNIEIILRLINELKKVQPEAKLWLGGPEVSYDSERRLKLTPGLEGIMIGEGEQTFLELVQHYTLGEPALKKIKGIAYRDNNLIRITEERELLALSDVPFPYVDIKNFKNRIIYYESSRGCPFSCSYCLSSVEKRIRFRDLSLVKQELLFLLEQQVPQVKFVDRTFNCNKEHAMAIWQFIKENDNGITNFHFEISADLLTDEELSFLATLRIAQVQFEIGVQSTNPDTVAAIRRRMDLKLLRKNVDRIRVARNIHQHLDLIAGLPNEDYKTFEQSFHDVYEMKPDQLQLGFLKVLRGSPMEAES
ncbi:MAG: Fe-S oxidoreductase, partial [Firmicutes bacterium]|nr:Fe-S oxidoreductase [Bacillota bacterium]